MSRNASGTYSLPAGNPVVTGTTTASAWANNTMSDVAAELTSSLDRAGRGPMLAALALNAGASVAAPDLTWTGDSDTGLYRSAANSVALACAGTKILEVTTTVFTALADVLLGSVKVILDTANSILKQTAANSSLTLQGNRSAADTGDDVIVNSAATRTAGNLLNVKSNGTSKLTVDFAGQLHWPSGPASTATSPAPSAVTAPTPNANVTAGNNLGYFKGPDNIVHFRGSLTNATGGNISNWITTTPIPAGFRPGATRAYWCSSASAGNFSLEVHSDGTIVSSVAQVNGSVAFLDCISYLAEA